MNKNVDALVVPGTYTSHMHTFFGSDIITNVKPTTAESQKGCYSGDNANDLSVYCKQAAGGCIVHRNTNTWEGYQPFTTSKTMSAWKSLSSASAPTTRTVVMPRSPFLPIPASLLVTPQQRRKPKPTTGTISLSGGARVTKLRRKTLPSSLRRPAPPICRSSSASRTATAVRP